MIISQSGIVDIIPEYNRQLRPIFCVSEGDKNTRMINITVQQAGENFSIPSGASVYVTGKKQDNTIFTYQCTKSGYIVSFQIAEQMSAANGIVLCELQIIENGNPLGSANFVYWVEPSPIDGGNASESDLNVFLEAIIGADKLDHFWANVEETVAEAVEAIQIHEGQTVIDASLSVSGAAADAKATGDIVRAFMNALITETTEEATVATCDDAAGGLPLKTLTANIVPTQSGSGDPSPDNVRAITGYTGVTVARTGKNIVEIPTGTYRGLVITRNNDGTFNINGTTTNSVDINIFSYNPNMSLCPFRGNYKISINGDFTVTGSGGVYASDNNKNRIFSYKTSGTYTTANGIGRMWMYFPSAVTVSGDHVQLMVCPAEFDDTYEGYNGAEYTITFPTAAGTVYGGTLIVNSDGSGTLTVDRGCFTSEEFASHAKGGTTSFNEFFFRTRAGQNPLVRTALNNDIICSHAKLYTPTDTTDVQCRMTSGQPRIIFPLDMMSTLEEFDAWLAEQVAAGTPLQFSYILATPTTYALSAVQVAQMLQGVNNIWTDAAGTLTAEYYANTSLYVDKKVNAQRNMIAGVEEAMIATKNYAIGDLMIVGNTLYKVTAAISSGAALVVGTNVTETTVAEQLLALA